MTETELAFLAVGLLLGAAAGAALIVILGTRPPRREIRVTVTRDAVPRRSITLSGDAFAAPAGAVAPGGPGDRRLVDREGIAAPVVRPAAAAATLSSASQAGGIVAVGPGRIADWDRTIVPFGAAARPAATAIAFSAGVGAVAEAEREPVTAPEPALNRILRGDHRAMVEVLDAIAGSDGRARREWELLITGLAEALTESAIDEAVIDFPVGAAFWDAFTIEECRRIVRGLASMGFAYDGRDGWRDGRMPPYRDLSQAMADVGLDPRRVRAWPNSTEVALLFQGARAVPEELVLGAAPDLDLVAVRELLGARADRLPGLWLTWEQVRPLLLATGGPASILTEASASE